MAEEAAKTKAKPAKASSKPDLATIGGLLLAVAGIMGGLLLEGGKVADVRQVTAAMIVLGGTLGAVMVTTPVNVLLRAARRLPAVFLDSGVDLGSLIEQIVTFAGKARKDGIVALEKDAESAADPFLKRALSLAVDGTDPAQIREMMELEIHLVEQEGHAEAKVFEAAGGYSPTIGIIGAVLGLIQVMKNLANIDEVGRGIAVAFVATVYGVASANLFFIPAGNKLKARLHDRVQRLELTLEGIIGLVEGMNPRMIRTKLEIYQRNVPAPAKDKGKKAPVAEKAAAAAEA